MAIEVTSVAEAEKKDRRQKQIIIALFVVGFLGMGYAAYDYVTLVNRATLPPSLSDVDPVIEKWKQDGLVTRFDPQSYTIVVNETEWADKRRPEKIGIITQLARYCAEKNNAPTWALTVKGNTTSATLGEMGPRGILLN